MNKWQPIETAPEGADVLISYDGHMAVATLEKDKEGVPQWLICSRTNAVVMILAKAVPTHWMPLPEAPQ